MQINPNTGYYVSGVGHLTLISWMFLGGVFNSEPPPFEMTDVSMITGAEFEAMMAAHRPPDSATEVAQPQAPDVTPDAPEVAPTTDEAVAQPEPTQTPAPTEDTPPEVTELTPPPEAEVSDEPPELDQPVGDTAVLVPDIAPEAVPRPVERVAPLAVAQPEPDATPSEIEQAAVAPEETGETQEETQEAQAPEEATTEIVTEAASAPKASARPPGRRPAAPAPQVAETADDTEDNNAAAIAAAVASAQDVAETADAPVRSGPPLTRGEKDALRVAVSQCWNVGALSSEALETVIVVSMRMKQNGTPVVESMNMDSFTGGAAASARRVYQAARSAVVRCGSRGFDLPAEKYGQWQSIEMTFDPREMAMR